MTTWRPVLLLALATLAQWVLCAAVVNAGYPVIAGFGVGCAAGLVHLRPGEAAWNVKALRAGMFPLSYCALAASQSVPSWIWGILALVGLLIFPRFDRGSAPLWRSPPEVSTALGVALASLGERPARAFDAGCGLGDGVIALKAAMPWAKVGGVEAAWLPWAIARGRCGPGVERGDMWRSSWAGSDLVYLFLRPEAMNRAREKIIAEMKPSAIVASLDFEFEQAFCLDERDAKPGRALRLYRVADLKR